MPSIIWKFDKAEIPNFLHGLMPFILTNGSLPNNKNHILCERKKKHSKNMLEISLIHTGILNHQIIVVLIKTPS